jgi:hypothetical protein
VNNKKNSDKTEVNGAFWILEDITVCDVEDVSDSVEWLVKTEVLNFTKFQFQLFLIVAKLTEINMHRSDIYVAILVVYCFFVVLCCR